MKRSNFSTRVFCNSRAPRFFFHFNLPSFVPHLRSFLVGWFCWVGGWWSGGLAVWVGGGWLVGFVGAWLVSSFGWFGWFVGGWVCWLVGRAGTFRLLVGWLVRCSFLPWWVGSWLVVPVFFLLSFLPSRALSFLPFRRGCGC